MMSETKNIRLIRKLDRVHAVVDGVEIEKPVKIVWTRPMTGRGQEVSILGDDNKEIAMLTSLDCLDETSREIAEQELERRYLIAKVTRIVRAHLQMGYRYLSLETDRGPKIVMIKQVSKDVVWLEDDRVLLKDTFGNRYEIESLSALDQASQKAFDMII